MTVSKKVKINRARLAISGLDNERALFARTPVICVSPAIATSETTPIFEIGVETAVGQAIVKLALQHWDHLIATAAAELRELQQDIGCSGPEAS